MEKTCPNCKCEILEGSKFCPECGAPLDREPTSPDKTDTIRETDVPSTEQKPKRKRKSAAESAPVPTEKISDNITLFSDGKYRWTYKFDLLKNPTVFFTIWKVFFYIILAGFVITFLVSLGARNFFWEGFLSVLKGYAIAIGVMTGVALLGYLIYAAIMGGKYIVEFEMDAAGILHTQTAAQAKKAKKLGAATSLAGAASGSLTTIGIGMTAATKTASYSDFSKVRRVKANRLTRVIFVNELIEHNQVYAEKEDFDFVKNFIIDHCKNAKKKK